MSCPWKTNAHSAGIKFLGIVRVRLRGGILSFSALLGLAFGAWALLMARSYPRFLLEVNYFLFCQISYAILAFCLRKARWKAPSRFLLAPEISSARGFCWRAITPGPCELL